MLKIYRRCDVLSLKKKKPPHSDTKSAVQTDLLRFSLMVLDPRQHQLVLPLEFHSIIFVAPQISQHNP